MKVIKAFDLKIQRLHNETIWLQNAQKTVENELSKLKLQEICDWVEKQRTLYADYFDELQQVKNVIVYYHRMKEVFRPENTSHCNGDGRQYRVGIPFMSNKS